MSEFSTYEKMRCARREALLRPRHYDKLVTAGRMTKEKAEYQIAVMTAIAIDYEQQWQAEGNHEPPYELSDRNRGIW